MRNDGTYRALGQLTNQSRWHDAGRAGAQLQARIDLRVYCISGSIRTLVHILATGARASRKMNVDVGWVSEIHHLQGSSGRSRNVAIHARLARSSLQSMAASALLQRDTEKARARSHGIHARALSPMGRSRRRAHEGCTFGVLEIISDLPCPPRTERAAAVETAAKTHLI